MLNNNKVSNNADPQEIKDTIANPYKKNCHTINPEQVTLFNQLAEQIGEIQGDLKNLNQQHKVCVSYIDAKIMKIYLILGFLYNTFDLDILDVLEKTQPNSDTNSGGILQ